MLRTGDEPGDDDYDEWPIDSGAPATAEGLPLVLGDATAWTAYDDADRN